jgi:two-component system, NtrC family, response regulator AtoC
MIPDSLPSLLRHARPGINQTTPMESAGGPSPHVSALLFVFGDGFVSTYEIADRELVIGRGEGVDIRIEHRSLSRRHAVVRPGSPVTVCDLGSTNGSRIGGALRRGGEPHVLAPSDSFHIGPFSFLVVARRPPDDRSLSARDVLRVSDPTPPGVPELVKDIAASPASVLILGETGVGKEVMAETLHELSGRTGPFIRINCAALSESLLESELFGHEKGAFTGAAAAKSGLLEAAQGGTVFLDELGELPLAIQAKLLRAVEHREVLRLGAVKPNRIDVRFIAATNRDLPTEVAAGTFRRDLFFRLDGVTLVIPPLRERRGLIGPLALRFLQAHQRADGPSRRLSNEVLAALEAYPWPGNVRELRTVIDRAVLLARSGEIGVRHLTFARRTTPEAPPPAPDMHTPPVPVAPFLDEAQKADRARVIAALEECAGNQTRAAKALGIGRTSLVQKLRLYRIPRPRT